MVYDNWGPSPQIIKLYNGTVFTSKCKYYYSCRSQAITFVQLPIYLCIGTYLPTFKILCGVVSVSSLNTALIYNHLYNPSNKASLENAMIRSNAIIPRFLMNSTLSSSALLLQKWNKKGILVYNIYEKSYTTAIITPFLNQNVFKMYFLFSKIGTKSNFPTPIEFRIYFDN